MKAYMGGPINWIPTEVDTETPNAARVYDSITTIATLSRPCTTAGLTLPT